VQSEQNAQKEQGKGGRAQTDGFPPRARSSQTGPSREAQRQLQRQAEGSHPRARAFLRAPRQSFFHYCGPRISSSLAQIFSHLTPPCIYIFPRPHLSRPTPTFLETPPGAIFRPLPACPPREVRPALVAVRCSRSDRLSSVSGDGIWAYGARSRRQAACSG
jgi:hypothetical protein